ncbi:MAG: hypothetical protein QOH35_1678 [Acidobacteriaceae bacterium]|nr:hypothetical protein [Acidobacteriaceae bacterium]
MNRRFGNSVEEKPLNSMRIVSNLRKPKTRSSTFLDESRIEVLNEPSGNWSERKWPIASREVEPAGGFERPICRLQFGRSDIELHRHMKLLIPQSPRTHSGRDNRMRQIANKTAMKLCLHAEPSPQGKGHEISGDKNLLKPIADLELP